MPQVNTFLVGRRGDPGAGVQDQRQPGLGLRHRGDRHVHVHRVLATVVFRRQFHWSRIATVAVFGGFFLIDIVFFSANTLKVVEGGWVPLALGLALTALMTSWKRGRDLLLARWQQDSMPLALFLARLPQSRTVRVPGLAVFLTGNPDYVPTSLLHNLKHNKVLHEQVLFVTVQNVDEPEVGAISAPRSRSWRRASTA